MRNLFLVRHGQAFDNPQNEQRRLTAQGRSEVTKTANFLKNSRLKISQIITSRKFRAIETARILAEVLDSESLIREADGLLPNDPPDNFLSFIENTNDDILVVGHLPFLLNLACLLLSITNNSFNLKFSTAAVLGFKEDSPGQWQLFFYITPDLL